MAKKSASAPVRGRDGYYTLSDGTRLISVTTILKRGIPKENLIHWSAREVAQCAVDNIPKLARVRGKSARQDMFTWLRNAAERKRDRAAALGSEVHNLAEARILGEPYRDPTEEEQPFVDAFLRFYEREKPEYEATEMVVANPEDGWAGTLDAAALLPVLAAERPGVERLSGLLALDYKGLALDTAIPTPSGWATMRGLKVGDAVFGSDGSPCQVTAKSDVHWRNCYRIRFDDGSSVICDDEHRWLTTSGRNSGHERTTTSVKTTEQIRRTRTLYGRNQHRVPVAGAIQTERVNLPIDPYVLGCWLGDGSTTGGLITSNDPEIFDLVEARGYTVGAPHRSPNRCPTACVFGLRTQLREADLLGHKVIPERYLRSATDQRLDLLRGLMDTDGSWNSTRQQAVFTTTDKGLAEGVRELACSLSQRAVIHTSMQTGFGVTVEAYQVTFRPVGLNPFNLSRKALRAVPKTTGHSKQRVIVVVERIPTVPTQCISVDSADNTYLCTEAFIPTHNTGNGIYGEASGQLAAYRRATVGWLKDGTEVVPPATTGAVVIHLRPERYPDRGYRIFSDIDTSDEVYEAFLAARETALRWTAAFSKRIVGEPFEPEETP